MNFDLNLAVNEIKDFILYREYTSYNVFSNL